MKRRSLSNFSIKSKSYWDSTLNLPETTLPIRSQLNDHEFMDAVSHNLYEKLSARQDQPDFKLIDGPPFANGDLHVGHALNKLLKDTILRLKGQQGYRIEFQPAWDCHGLPIELKALQHKSSASKSLDPIEIRRLCRKFALEAIEKQKRSMQKWGIMADYNRPLLTMDPKFEANQLRVLSAMIDKNLIYSARKPVYFSPSSQTALAEAELEYSDDHVSLTALLRFKAHLSDNLKSKLPDPIKSVSFVAWTTTPWTLPSNKALAVRKDIVYSLIYSNSFNEYLIIAKSRIPFICACLQHSLDTIISDFCRGSELSTCHYESLQFSPTDDLKTVNPVLLGDFVTDDSGSGIVHLAPDYGTDDFDACKSVGIELNAQEYLTDQGNFTSAAPSFLKGLNIFSGASETILEYLKCTGNFLSSEYYTHRYPYDWRTKKPVIQRATRQWFASISSILPQLQKSLEDVRFIPEHGKDKMLSMLKNRTDWCISRQRHWGVPIPALQNIADKSMVLDSSFINHVARLIESDARGSDIWWTRPLKDLLDANSDFNENLLSKTFHTLDVWFDSGTVWNNFSKVPVDLYLEGSDQYRGWFQSSLITSVSVLERAPYKTVLTHGFALDQKGQKMSKSVGNVVNPDEIVDKYGSDVLRLWAASSNFKMDVNIGPDIIKQVAENKRKIRNILRFILGNLKGYQRGSVKHFRQIDLLMLSKLNEFQESCRLSFDSYDFPAAIQQLSRFCVQDLSAFYFEILKDRLYTEALESPLRQAAQSVLITILNSIQQIISPLMPFLAQEIQASINNFDFMDINELSKSSDIEVKEFEMIQQLRSDFLEWFNTKGKAELSVKNTFQLDIKIFCPSKLNKFNSEDLREIFMVASVDLIQGSSSFKIESIKASDRCKCPRCWTFNSSNPEELCSRCIEQTNQIKRCVI